MGRKVRRCRRVRRGTARCWSASCPAIWSRWCSPKTARARVLRRGDDPSGRADPGQHLQRRHHQQYRHHLYKPPSSITNVKNGSCRSTKCTPIASSPPTNPPGGVKIPAHPGCSSPGMKSSCSSEGAQRLQRRVPDHMAVACRAFPRGTRAVLTLGQEQIGISASGGRAQPFASSSGP